LVVCTVVQLTLVPLLIYHNNQVSLSAVLNNLVMVPLFGAFLVAGFLDLALFWTPLAPVLAAVITQLAELLKVTLGGLDSINVTASAASPHPLAVLGLLALCVALPRFPPKWRMVVLCLPLMTLLPCSTPKTSGRLTATLLDVGQSEAIHLSYPDGRQAFIDTGGSSLASANRFLARQVLVRYLLNQGVRRLDFVLITHPESDHRGTYLELLRLIPVATTIHGESLAGYPGCQVRVSQGNTFSISGIEHRILNPSARPAGGESNANSIVLEIRYRDFRMLLTGDAPAAIERRLLDLLHPVDILKVGHHGSRSSSSRSFLELLHPRVGLISAGRHNRFGHPSPEVLERLDTAGAQSFCTATSGSLRISTDGASWDLAAFTLQSGSFQTVVSASCQRASSQSLDTQK
jgi:competence protein ComEC